MPLALLTAIAASLMTHVTAIFLPEGDWLPASHEEAAAVTLHAELQTPAPPSAKHVAKQSKPLKPNRSPSPQATPSSAPPLSPHSTEQLASPNTTEPEPPTKTESSIPPTPVAPPGNSHQGSLTYRVYKGTQGFEVGRSTHQWNITDTHYSLRSHTETSGLAGLFYPITIELQSTGEFGTDGFIPSQFRTLKHGEETKENADFDWQKGTIRLARDSKDRMLAAGSQDLLSFPFQLAYRVRQLGPEEAVFPLHVASGKRYDAFNFTVQGEESIQTLAGTFRSLHLKATAPNNSADTTDIWLAIEHQWLAIKIRFTDRNGDSFEQVLERLETQSK